MRIFSLLESETLGPSQWRLARCVCSGLRVDQGPNQLHAAARGGDVSGVGGVGLGRETSPTQSQLCGDQGNKSQGSFGAPDTGLCRSPSQYESP